MPRPVVPPRRVLVVMAKRGVGDAAEATAVFELLHRHWPDTEVVAGIYKEKQEPVFRGSPYVDRVVRLPGHPRDHGRALRALVPTTLLLRQFEHALFLDRAERCAWPLLLAARLAGTRLHRRHGYRYRNRRKSALADFPAHVFFQITASELLLRRPLAELAAPHMVPAEDDQRWADELFRRRSWEGQPVVLLNTRGPQYGDSMGRWGIERYLALADLLVDRGVTVVVNGGSDAQVKEFQDARHLADPRVELLERPDVGQLAAVARRCAVVVGEPSGPLCLAIAVGAATVTIQGPGEHDFPGHNRSGPIWWPYAPQHASVSRVAWCERAYPGACLCSQDTKSWVKKRLEPVHLWKPYKKLLRRIGVFDRLHPSRALRPTFHCLEQLTPEEVATAVLGHLERTAGPHPQTTVRSTSNASA